LTNSSGRYLYSFIDKMEITILHKIIIARRYVWVPIIEGRGAREGHVPPGIIIKYSKKFNT